MHFCRKIALKNNINCIIIKHNHEKRQPKEI